MSARVRGDRTKKIIKTRYILIITFILSLIVCATAFSVSYAKWTGGTDTLAATLSTGKWNVRNLDNMTNDVAVGILKDKLTEDKVSVPGSNPQIGGVIGINDPAVTAAVWQNGSGTDGYTTSSLYMKAGTTFIICVFNRIVDPTNKDKSKGQDGFAVLKTEECNGFGYLDYHISGDDVTDNTRYVFTVKEDGWYTIDVHEGDQDRSWSWGWVYPDDYNKHDIVTITYSATQPA